MEGLISEDIVAKEKFGLIGNQKTLIWQFFRNTVSNSKNLNFHKSSDNRSIVLYEGEPPPEQSENEAYFQLDWKQT